MGAPATLTVLTAAGSGTRLGAEVPKALVPLAGHSLLAWALRNLAAAGGIREVCITIPPGTETEFAREVRRRDWPFETHLVAGGPSRQESVALGLDCLQNAAGAGGIPSSTPILVHDAARCLASPELIRSLIEAVSGEIEAVIPGLPVVDTIKEIEDPEEVPAGAPAGLSPVVNTPKRSLLRSIQTPQAFHWQVLRDAHERGRHLGSDEATAATDDAGLVELFGGQVWVAPGDPLALKITSAADLLQATTLAERLHF